MIHRVSTEVRGIFEASNPTNDGFLELSPHIMSGVMGPWSTLEVQGSFECISREVCGGGVRVSLKNCKLAPAWDRIFQHQWMSEALLAQQDWHIYGFCIIVIAEGAIVQRVDPTLFRIYIRELPGLETVWRLVRHRNMTQRTVQEPDLRAEDVIVMVKHRPRATRNGYVLTSPMALLQGPAIYVTDMLAFSRDAARLMCNPRTITEPVPLSVESMQHKMDMADDQFAQPERPSTMFHEGFMLTKAAHSMMLQSQKGLMKKLNSEYVSPVDEANIVIRRRRPQNEEQIADERKLSHADTPQGPKDIKDYLSMYEGWVGKIMGVPPSMWSSSTSRQAEAVNKASLRLLYMTKHAWAKDLEFFYHTLYKRIFPSATMVAHLVKKVRREMKRAQENNTTAAGIRARGDREREEDFRFWKEYSNMRPPEREGEMPAPIAGMHIDGRVRFKGPNANTPLDPYGNGGEGGQEEEKSDGDDELRQGRKKRPFEFDDEPIDQVHFAFPGTQDPDKMLDFTLMGLVDWKIAKGYIAQSSCIPEEDMMETPRIQPWAMECAQMMGGKMGNEDKDGIKSARTAVGSKVKSKSEGQGSRRGK